MVFSAILCAAGLSMRMGHDKLLFEYHSRTLISYAIDLLCRIPADERIIVITKDRIDKTDIPPDVKTIINTNPQKGKSGSVRLGVSSAAGTHFLFLNADQPAITPADIIELIELSKQNPDKIIYPVIDGCACSPAVFPGTLRDKLLKLTGDTGGRAVRESCPQLCLPYKPMHPERFRDIDTQEDARD